MQARTGGHEIKRGPVERTQPRLNRHRGGETRGVIQPQGHALRICLFNTHWRSLGCADQSLTKRLPPADISPYPAADTVVR